MEFDYSVVAKAAEFCGTLASCVDNFLTVGTNFNENLPNSL